MESKPIVSHINIYPVKSLDGVSSQKAQIGKGASLLHDREFAIISSDGNFIIGKTNPLVHLLCTAVDFDNHIISFRHREEPKWFSFHLENEQTFIDDYLSIFFKQPVSLQQNTEGGFLDIPGFSGITLLSTESLKAVASWYGDMDLDETRKRFRATVEIAAVPAFWEDMLFDKEGTGVAFKLGEITLLGNAPRERCVVPTRHPETGAVTFAFPKLFAKHRAATLPQSSALKYYRHYYFLSVDCSIADTDIGKWIKVGDELSIIGKKKLQ